MGISLERKYIQKKTYIEKIFIKEGYTWNGDTNEKGTHGEKTNIKKRCIQRDNIYRQRTYIKRRYTWKRDIYGVGTYIKREYIWKEDIL